MARLPSTSASSSALILSNLVFILFTQIAAALQVTSGSPCTSFCVDSSKAKAAETIGDDIVCADDDFNSESNGQKFQRCLACLEDSDFTNGDENDQDWYLYNLRYAFDYCIFGYPNATDIGSNPCMTSEACGPLEDALKLGITTPDNRTQYDYCDADGKVMLTDSYSDCYSCVRADGTHKYVSNFLVALEAGCQQQPSAGTPVSLNDTVFTDAAVQAVNPTTESDSDNGALANTAIAGIAVGALVVILFLAGCVYMQYRKRKNRAARLHRRRTPSFSYYGSPTGGADYGDASGVDKYNNVVVAMEEKPYADSSPGFGINMDSRASLSSSSSRTHPKLANITTSLPCPPPIHSSPRQQSSPDDYTTPTSTTSTRSNAPLLRSPLLSPGFSIATPRNTSPRLTRDTHEPWENQRVAGSGRDLVKKKGSWGAIAPVEFQNIQTTFDPPPRR